MSAGILFFLASLSLAAWAVWMAARGPVRFFFRELRGNGNVRFDHRVIGCNRRYRP